jgi:mono/diheme cytochrome c family protein
MSTRDRIPRSRNARCIAQRRTRLRTLTLALPLLALGLALPAAGEEAKPPTGSQLYAKYCASCHGLDGRGGTPLAGLFKKDPPALTRIAERRRGWFPEVIIQEIVDGRLAAHGWREMPVWGATLSHDEILLITEHLYAIQDPVPPPAP